MSDTEKSSVALDEPTATTPAAQSGDKCANLGSDQSASTQQHTESITEQASQPEAPQQQSDFAFGTSRGSGLARGKRKTVTAPDAPTAQDTPNGYQPTAIEVITPKSEYSNPFTGETVVETPRQEEAPKRDVPKSEEPLIRATPTSEEHSAEPEPPTTPTASESAAAPPTEAQPKPELKILPPAQPNRSRQSWESPSEHPAHRAAAAAANGEKVNNDSGNEAPRSRSPRGSSEGRPTFQPERRSRNPQNGEADERSPRPEKQFREERPKRESREPRDSRDSRSEQRSSRTAGAPTKPAAKPQGFFGWLKSLFGGSSSAHPKTAKSNEQRHEGGPKRRSRGGRGRSTSNGPRGGSESFSGRRNTEKPVGDRSSPSRGSEEQRDRPRNRSRGGRGGRSRSGHRPEGQQSGGAI